MPDNQFNYWQARSELVQQCLSGATLESAMKTRMPTYVKKENQIISSVMSNAKGCHADRAFAPVVDMGELAATSPKKSRAKESSQHFGVRFRPDLQKWVAEIRVAEWKTVDKKVWLGTFDSEEGAARAVDAARKLLQCKKKRPPNFPCDALAAYAEHIPAALDLNNLRDESMFKEVTLFVKRKAQEYAAGFCPDHKTSVASCISIAADQIPVNCTSEMENISYCTSSAGTSPEESSWFYVEPCFDIVSYPHVEEQCVDGGWTNLMNRENHDGWELDMDLPFDPNELLFPNDLEPEATMDHEMLYNLESQNQTYSIQSGDDWTHQWNLNSYMLMSSVEYNTTPVC